MAPPAAAEFPLRVLEITVKVALPPLSPSFKMAPPRLLPPWFPLRVLAITVNDALPDEPSLLMPPPRLLAAKPLVMVRPAMVAVLAGAMRKTRLEPLPLMMTLVGPGPRIERGEVMRSSPEVNEIVP